MLAGLSIFNPKTEAFCSFSREDGLISSLSIFGAIREEQPYQEISEHRDKLQEYDCHLETLQERNSYSKTDKDAI